MDDLEDFYQHTVTVQTLLGSGGMGDVYAAPLTLSPTDTTGVFVEDKRRLVRSADGSEVISESTIYGRWVLGPVLAVGSLVTLPSGRTATVITTARYAAGVLDLPDHVEAALT